MEIVGGVPMTIGDRIRNLRLEKGWTQADLAKKVGYKDKTAISCIENGKNELNQPKIIKFAEILGTTTSYLMGWEDDDPEELADIMANPDVINIAVKYYKLNSINKEFVRNTIEMLAKKQEND